MNQSQVKTDQIRCLGLMDRKRWTRPCPTGPPWRIKPARRRRIRLAADDWPNNKSFERANGALQFKSQQLSVSDFTKFLRRNSFLVQASSQHTSQQLIGWLIDLLRSPSFPMNSAQQRVPRGNRIPQRRFSSFRFAGHHRRQPREKIDFQLDANGLYDSLKKHTWFRVFTSPYHFLPLCCWTMLGDAFYFHISYRYRKRTPRDGSSLFRVAAEQVRNLLAYRLF